MSTQKLLNIITKPAATSVHVTVVSDNAKNGTVATTKPKTPSSHKLNILLLDIYIEININ